MSLTAVRASDLAFVDMLFFPAFIFQDRSEDWVGISSVLRVQFGRLRCYLVLMLKQCRDVDNI
jgi:hypothetical protein